jgi:predicted transcriptional regulator
MLMAYDTGVSREYGVLRRNSWYSPGMALKTVTFRAPEEKISTLDAVAELQQRDRTFILNEAVDQYLSLYEYHRELIQERLREDDAGGETYSHEEVMATAASWSKKTKSTVR